MTISCPHCLDPIRWQAAWLAFIPGALVTCPRCQSRLSNNRSARTNQLIVAGWIAFVLTIGLSTAVTFGPAIDFGLKICGLLAIGVILMGFMGLGRLRVVRAAGRFCYRCGYNLTTNASGVCPECGGDSPVPVDWSQFRDEPLPHELLPKPAPPPADFELQIPANLVDPSLTNSPRDGA